jgi:hypothetical protein
MKFYTEVRTGDIILIKTNIPTPPPCPIIARSVKPTPPALISLVSAFVILLATIIAPLIPHQLPRLPSFSVAPQFALLSIITMALIEVIAQGYIEKSLGVIT